ncbi:MAG: hypothetical protein E7553_05345 [Ruminococcaceae bacterium]|nr:hypothetical protein [Oscillospiraceae bacterium]
MKPIDGYKEAVMRRVEDKKAAQKAMTRRVVAVCLPLFLCTVLLGLTALSHNFPLSEDTVPPTTGDTFDESEGTPDAAVYRNGITYPVEDADAFYEAVLSLFDTNITGADAPGSPENGSVGGVSDYGSSSESYYEDDGGLSEEAGPCTLIFRRPDGVHEFFLQDGMLFDGNTRESVPVTAAQEYALRNGEASIDCYYEDADYYCEDADYYCEDPDLYSPPSSYDAVQWFPCRERFEYDDLWEVQTDGDYCQRFTETVEDTGNTNLLDTVFDKDGSLTITRNEVAGSTSPFIRTLPFEVGPILNIRNGNVLHIDFEATADWSIRLIFYSTHTVFGYYKKDTVYTEYPIDLSHAIAQACGQDGGAGRYTAALNLYAVLQALADEGDEAATAVLSMDTVMLPHLRIDCIGDTGSSLTIHKFLYSAPDDPQGDQCYFVCLDVMVGNYISKNALPTAMRRTTVPRTTTTTTKITMTFYAPTTTTTVNVTPTPSSTSSSTFLWVIGGIAVAISVGIGIVLHKRR